MVEFCLKPQKTKMFNTMWRYNSSNTLRKTSQYCVKNMSIEVSMISISKRQQSPGAPSWASEDDR